MDPLAVSAEREAVWEERLRELAHAAEVDLARLGSQKSSPEKVLLAAALKLSTSVSNAWLARRLDMGEPASASQFVRRQLLGAAGRKQVEQLIGKGARR